MFETKYMFVLHVFNDSVGNYRAALQEVSFNSTIKMTLQCALHLEFQYQ